MWFVFPTCFAPVRAALSHQLIAKMANKEEGFVDVAEVEVEETSNQKLKQS